VRIVPLSRRRAVTAAFAFAAAANLRLPAGAQTLTPVRVAAVPSDDVAVLVYGIRSGLFKSVGLDVTYTPAASGAAIIAALLAGVYEVGHSSIVSLLNARARSIPVSLIAPGSVYDAKAPYAELICASDLPYKTGADLNGKIVAVSALRDLNTMGTSAWVDATGGDSKTLKFVEIPISAVPAACEEHRVDAGMVYYPPLGTALAAGKVRILAPAFSAVGNYYMTSGWATSDDWASKHLDAARTFAATYLKAIAYANAHHAETAPLSAEITSTPLDVVQKTVRVNSAPSLAVPILQPMIDAAAKYGLIPKSIPARELVFSGLPAAK
jgi:NitT/TauT family transport system substrate-binding protein